MFYVQNSDYVVCFKSESFDEAKQVALKMKEDCGENFTIADLRIVWTTQPLDEALKNLDETLKKVDDVGQSS